MVSTRACKKNTEKNKDKNCVKSTGSEKSKMRIENKPASSSNVESEDEDDPTPISASVSSGKHGSSIKVTLKKTRSCSSTSSRESTQSFEVVRSLPPMPEENVSGAEDSGGQKDSEKQHSDNNNDKESESESHNAISSGDDDQIEILSSDDSDECTTEKPDRKNLLFSDIEDDKKDFKNIPLTTELYLKTETPQNFTQVKNEDCKVKIKCLKEEVLKKEVLKKEVLKEEVLKEENLKETDLDSEIVVVNDDDDNDTEPRAEHVDSQVQNGVQKVETKEQLKGKVNVRSFDDLAAPQAPNLINMPPPTQIDETPNFLSQNGSPFQSQYINMSCDVCRIQFDTADLLNEHKVAMKHYRCSYKECECLVLSSHQELLDHQRMIHNVMQSPVQQLAHQVQRLPAMGFDQQLQSGVPPLSENLPRQPSMPNMYTHPLRMPNQPVPMQRNIRPMMRSTTPHMMSTRGRATIRATRGRPASMNMNMGRGGSIKRPSPMPMRQTPPIKRVATDRNSYTNNMNKTPQLVKSLSESLTKSLTTVNKSPAPTQQDVVNLFSKRGLTISTVDTVNNISLPAGLSLNSAVSIIPTSPHKTPTKLPKHVPQKKLDTVDLTGPDKPRENKFYPCDICSKTYTSIETLYDHISAVHKSVVLPFKCNLCTGTYPNADVLNRHKQSFHRSEVNTNIPYVIPIIDFNRPGTSAKLQSMGITSYVPVAQLDNQNGQFGVPIMSVSRPGSVDGLRYTNFFNLGCIRKM